MDIFKTLAAGAKFQKEKTKPLADLFRGSSSTTSSSSQEDDDLNFFRAPKPKEGKCSIFSASLFSKRSLN